MNLDPRKRFKASTSGKTWHEAVSQDWFQEGLQVSLATMALNTGLSTDMGTAAAIACRAEGARQLIGVMLNLTESELEKKPVGMPPNLKATK